MALEVVDFPARVFNPLYGQVDGAAETLPMCPDQCAISLDGKHIAYAWRRGGMPLQWLPSAPPEAIQRAEIQRWFESQIGAAVSKATMPVMLDAPIQASEQTALEYGPEDESEDDSE